MQSNLKHNSDRDMDLEVILLFYMNLLVNFHKLKIVPPQNCLLKYIRGCLVGLVMSMTLSQFSLMFQEKLYQ